MSRIAKIFFVILTIILIPLWLIASCQRKWYNIKPMGSEPIVKTKFQDNKSSFKLLSKTALDYYEEGTKNYSNLKHVCISSDGSEHMEVYYSCEDSKSNQSVYVVWDPEIKAAFTAVTEAMYHQSYKFAEGGLRVYAKQNQVDFSRGGKYHVTYRSDLRKPDSNHYYVDRLSGLHWYNTYSKD